LADVAALALIHYRPDHAGATDILTRAQSALAGKAAVDMATGLLAERGRLDLTQALHALHGYCRANGLRLTDTAQALVRRDLDVNSVLSILN
ncbi:ANTAR domain-containing protein, partial [Streptomyces sp. T-3]|nr:ANTAR domain-containing protein [Streptomyces sp. T-3]